MANVKRVELQDTIWKDYRGWGVNPIESAGISRESLGNIHIVSIKPGAIRGNHYHTNATEWILICGGSARIAWRALNKKSIHEVVVNEADPALFEIQPNIEHAVLNDSDKEIYLISFSNSYERCTVSSSSLFGAIERKGNPY
jgi:dTDP-4-dehydrorhamnose 3,5-epimerase-like enzyme